MSNVSRVVGILLRFIDPLFSLISQKIDLRFSVVVMEFCSLFKNAKLSHI